MATILPFVIRPRASAAARQSKAAAIIIFPGVRYEHAPATAGNGRRKPTADRPGRGKNKIN